MIFSISIYKIIEKIYLKSRVLLEIGLLLQPRVFKATFVQLFPPNNSHLSFQVSPHLCLMKDFQWYVASGVLSLIDIIGYYLCVVMLIAHAPG